MSLISATDLTKRYGSVVALDRLSIDVEPGITGLVGANGAGKSTFLKLMLGLLSPSSGTLRVLGMDVGEMGTGVRARIGYMPEHDCLPPDVSATEFVVHMARVSGLSAPAARERAADTLRHVGLHEERYRAMGQYSTGMRQRVKLAQALVHDPSLVLLDEPTNGLDPSGRDEMLDLITRIGTEFGISVLVTSHLLGELERICQSLVIIEGGALLRHTTIAAATTESGVLVVEVDGDPGLVSRDLQDAGIAVRAVGRMLEIDDADEAMNDVVRDSVARNNLGLVRLERRRHSMQELFTPDQQPQEVGRVS